MGPLLCRVPINIDGKCCSVWQLVIQADEFGYSLLNRKLCTDRSFSESVSFFHTKDSLKQLILLSNNKDPQCHSWKGP